MILEDIKPVISLSGVDPAVILSVIAALQKGAAGWDFFGTAEGQTGETYEGFKFGDGSVQADDTL